jgi:hypothetical protein
MFCPKCSQQQPADEMRYCSRCGFPLGGVALLLDNSGVIPTPTGQSTQKRLSARNRMISESAILTGITWGLAIGATFLFDFGRPFGFTAKLAAAVFFALGLIGLLRFLYAFLFVKDLPDSRSSFTRSGSERPVLGEPGRSALSASQSTPVSDYPRPINTKKMARRPSVTENTTRLLDD